MKTKSFILLFLSVFTFSLLQAQVIDKKEKKAFDKYLKAANKGDTAMQKKVAFCLLKGIGVNKNTAQAISWLTKVAAQGDLESQITLGQTYAQGIGVAKNDSLAFIWMKKGAENGDNVAQYWVGKAYSDGKGVKQDAEEGAKWYDMAARQGNLEAQLNLAKCYENGIGVTKDLEIAALWMAIAADQGNIQAKLWFVDYSTKNAKRKNLVEKLNEVKAMTTRPNIFIRDPQGLPQGDVLKDVRVWQKNGNNYVYNGPKVYGRSRFHGKGEYYSDPFAVCLPQPYSKVSFTVNPNTITFKFEDAIQVDCDFKRVKTSWGGESDDPVRPSDAMRGTFGCKGGAATYTGIMRNGHKTLKICVHNTCTHKIYQSFRTNRLSGRYTNGKQFEHADATGGGSADPYAPWRQVHNQTTVINLAENAKLNGMTKNEFVKELLDCDEWFVNKDNMYVLDDEASAIMFYSLWNTFGFKLPTAPAQDNTVQNNGVNKEPGFPGGTKKIIDHLNANVVYPTVAEENGVQGCVIISFTIEKDGAISDVSVAKSVDPSLDREALRLAKKMPRWIPAIKNGKVVRTNMEVPITFKLPQEEGNRR